MNKNRAGEIWDLLTATQRRAIIRMCFDYELSSVAKVESAQWGAMLKRDQNVLLKLDWEFCLGVKLQ